MIALDTLSESLRYIEEHLEDTLSLQSIADVAHYSPFHYQRLFQMLTGQTLFDYIRNRRLSQAARALLTEQVKIIDLSLRYGYESPEAFTRAFKKLYDVTPSQVKKESLVLKYYPKLEIQVHLKAEEPLRYKIVDMDALYLKGNQITFTANEIMEGKAYSMFWRKQKEPLKGLMKIHQTNLQVGAGAYRKENPDLYDAIVGCFVKDESQADLIVPPTKWCVFYGKGPLQETLHNLWSRIFLEWFPKTSFQHSGQTEIEIFPVGDSSSEQYTYEVWIPLRSVLHEI
ncbi:MAG: AraC family transcriptional regulator [Clostridia bacterium]|nr:AraC family transcriptional regulator [Clostridia bacterium]